MGFLNNIKVKTKLIVSFLIMVVLIALVGIIGILSLKALDINSEDMYGNNLQSVYILTDMKQNITEIKSDMLQLVYVRDASKKDSLEKDIESNKNENDRYITNYEKIPISNTEKKTWTTFKNQINRYRASRENIIKYMDDKQYDEAVDEYGQTAAIGEAMLGNLDILINANIENAKNSNINNHAVFQSSSNTMAVSIAAGIIIAFVFAFIISKNINVPLKDIKSFAERLSLYDFSSPISITRKDEFGQTGRALNEAQKNVNHLVKTIAENSQEISASSEELSATVEELSSKAETIDEAVNKIADGIHENSAAAEEISASVEEVDASISELSQRTMEGSSNASQSKDRAADAQSSSRKALEETKTLYAEKQKKMLAAIEAGKVVENIKIMADTIAEISEQVNLLALNAAIEAARAGEHGKGFSVIAGEVRKLSEQSAETVTYIRETIIRVQEAFTSSIDTGSDILNFINKDVLMQLDAYGRIGNQYYDDADFLSRMSGEVASLSEEIIATVGQVCATIQNMAETALQSNEKAETIKANVDETTKTIEQVALVAQSQSELAQKLNEMVLKFKI